MNGPLVELSFGAEAVQGVVPLEDFLNLTGIFTCLAMECEVS